MKNEDIIFHWIELVEKVPSEDYILIKDFSSFPDPAKAESLMWSNWFFIEKASPHYSENKAKHSYYRAGRVGIDLLRHEYSFGGFNFLVREGINFTLLSVNLPTSEKIKNLVEKISHATINMSDGEHQWRFHYPDKIIPKSIISTNPEKDIFFMSSWSERADVIVQNEKLYFLFYKKYPRSPTIGFRHDAQWFERE